MAYRLLPIAYYLFIFHFALCLSQYLSIPLKIYATFPIFLSTNDFDLKIYKNLPTRNLIRFS